MLNDKTYLFVDEILHKGLASTQRVSVQNPWMFDIPGTDQHFYIEGTPERVIEVLKVAQNYLAKNGTPLHKHLLKYLSSREGRVESDWLALLWFEPQQKHLDTAYQWISLSEWLTQNGDYPDTLERKEN